MGLNRQQEKLLEQFVLEFLANTGEKRRNSSNSLQTIHRSLNTVFSKNAGFELSERDVIDCFIRLNYGFSTHLENWSQLRIPSTIGFYEHVYEEILSNRKKFPRASIDEHIINISVRGFDVQELRLSQGRIVETSKPEKISSRRQMQVKIADFFNSHQNIETNNDKL
jgi:hypothetical protein